MQLDDKNKLKTILVFTFFLFVKTNALLTRDSIDYKN